MKKRIIAGMMVVCLLLFVGCGQSGNGTDDTAQKEKTGSAAASSETADAKNGSSDVLVVYFSRTGEQYNVGKIDKGNTAIVADMIVEQTGADSFEILPKKDYPYTYQELTNVAKKELNDQARPAYAGEVPDLTNYRTIFIGAPVWWGDWPMICYTFFEENADALAGKTLCPFPHMKEAVCRDLIKNFPARVLTVQSQKDSL